MPLFGKKNDKDDGEGLSQKEIDAFKSKNAELIATSSPAAARTAEPPASEEPDAQPETSATLPEEASEAGAGDHSDDSPGDPTVGQADIAEESEGDGNAGESSETGDSASSEGDGSASAKDDDPLGDDLMALFTLEEEVDDDLAALTKDLEDVDMNDLLTLAREVSAKLAECFPRT